MRDKIKWAIIKEQKGTGYKATYLCYDYAVAKMVYNAMLDNCDNVFLHIEKVRE